MDMIDTTECHEQLHWENQQCHTVIMFPAKYAQQFKIKLIYLYIFKNGYFSIYFCSCFSRDNTWDFRFSELLTSTLILASGPEFSRSTFFHWHLVDVFSFFILVHHGTSITRLSLHGKLSPNPTKRNKILSTILCN